MNKECIAIIQAVSKYPESRHIRGSYVLGPPISSAPPDAKCCFMGACYLEFHKQHPELEPSKDILIAADKILTFDQSHVIHLNDNQHKTFKEIAEELLKEVSKETSHEN